MLRRNDAGRKKLSRSRAPSTAGCMAPSALPVSMPSRFLQEIPGELIETAEGSLADAGETRRYEPDPNTPTPRKNLRAACAVRLLPLARLVPRLRGPERPRHTAPGNLVQIRSSGNACAMPRTETARSSTSRRRRRPQVHCSLFRPRHEEAHGTIRESQLGLK